MSTTPPQREIINYVKEVFVRVTPAEFVRRMVQVIQGWEKSCPEQPFAERTLEQFKQEMQLCLDAKANFEAADAQWEVARRERDVAYAKGNEQMLCVVNSVKGHPKYGENSPVYAAMGYVPKSERSSGLTRRRDPQKETAKSPEKEPQVTS